jgi:LysM repeat protein
MNSIRPLITISILIAAGVFLYTKINEAPAHLAPGANDAAQSAPGVPPLGETPSGPANSSATLTPGPALGSAPTAPTSAAPAWSGTIADATKTTPPPAPAFPSASLTPDSMSKAGAPPAAAPSATPEAIGLPEIPKIPDLPPLPNGAEASGSAASGPAIAPADAAKTTSAAPATLGGASPSAAPAASQPPMALTPPDDDRYGSIAAAPAAAVAPPAVSAPPPSATAATSFAAEWPAIQTALTQQELGKAHQMLSQWYGNPSLSPGEAEQVQSLLNQLAGTVVYSTQSCLEPPYTVKAGDTLESIAKQYDVPWQLLAKINGVAASDQVQAGQQLKVIHGPFAATVDLGKNQMTLILDGRYAGRFPITTEPNAATTEGQWVVEQKMASPSTSAAATSSVYAVGPAAVDHVLVLRKDATGPEISITSGPSSPSTPTAAAPPAIHLAPRDADEVADILSVGSRVTIRR